MILLFILMLLNISFTTTKALQKVRYQFGPPIIDVVIPCHEKDAKMLDPVINGIKKNIKKVRKIFIISKKKYTQKAYWIPENIFPFTKELIAIEIFHEDRTKAKAFIESPCSRIGWIYQQLLKLYAPFIIPNISSNVLVVDADTIFLKPITLINEHGGAMFNISDEYTWEYFEHTKKLLNIDKAFPEYSGIAHHMVFQRCVIKDLFGEIYKKHGMEPWKAICRCINPTHVYSSCMSEYEIYFNFCFARSDQFSIRKLEFRNEKLKNYKRAPNQKYVYISCHSWL